MTIKSLTSVLYRNPVLDVIKSSSEKIDSKLVHLNIPPFLKSSKLLGGIIIGIIIIVLILNSVFASPDSSVPVYKVVKDNFLVSVTESGELRAKNSISISSPRIRGNLKIVYLIPEGTYVNAGDTVVRFDPTEAITNLKDAEAKLEIAISDKAKLVANQKSGMTRLESDLKSAELSFELSKLNVEQMKFEASVKQQEAQLNHKRNELSFLKSKQDLESQKIIDQSEMNKTDIEVQQKRSDLERAKRDLEMLTLTAPTEGLVVYENNWATGRKVAIGDTPWSGMTLVSLPDLSAMESITYVNEVDVSRVKKGLPVVVKLDAFRDSSFNADISSVASLGKTKDNNSNIKVFEIAVFIKSQSEILKPGMTTSNKIVINEIPGVLFVPQEAVFEMDGKKIVYVKNGSGFDVQFVEVGEKSENYIVITKGLEENQEVALRDPTIVPEETGTGETESNSVSMPGS
ncbi:MAG: efflux RND transporter periplasmic adaptor subunit [Ignavibacteriales bacterium]|nr:MAG: efflux RND transporter periplasmic adaptor subunit [Ignavibacteriales bacterium]